MIGSEVSCLCLLLPMIPEVVFAVGPFSVWGVPFRVGNPAETLGKHQYQTDSKGN